jgi:transposase
MMHLQERIDETNMLVDELSKKIPLAQLIATVPGFGKFLSVLVAVEIGDIRRFEGVGNFHAYAGVIPSTHSSGDVSYHGKIIKAGNRWLRWVAVEAVWTAL